MTNIWQIISLSYDIKKIKIIKIENNKIHIGIFIIFNKIIIRYE